MSKVGDTLRSHRPSRRTSCLVVIALALLFLLSHATLLAQSQAPLRVAAAADLEPLLPSLLRNYEQQTGQHAEGSFASSATLATQIENGAPFDVFLSADMALPEKIVRDGFAAAGSTAQPYARGTLVLWTRNQSGVAPLSMQLLASPAIHSIAIANPQHAPYGRAAMQALTSLALVPAVESKLRTAENIAQAAQFASTGNADVGLISLTSALTLTAQGHYVAVPANAYQPILQGAVALKGGANPKGAVTFLQYLHSPAVAQQLQQGGLAPAR
ncbi:MAG: molybdate ABC transporter substrate-binding protein [Acidobacteriaceae bacterium]